MTLLMRKIMKKSSSQNNKKLISVGIDVGSSNGAIAIIDEDLNILTACKVPIYQTEIKSKRNTSKLNKQTGKYEKDYKKRSWVDFKELGKIFEPFIPAPLVLTIERVLVKPGEGEPSSFAFGNAMGIFQGLYPYLDPLAYYEPLAKDWKKEMGVTSDKDTSIKLALELYEVDLKKFVKRGKVDDIAEALLLAFYGLKKLYNK